MWGNAHGRSSLGEQPRRAPARRALATWYPLASRWLTCPAKPRGTTGPNVGTSTRQTRGLRLAPA
eukprot:3404794-Lingulodinium_polyedra.AAC.1